MIPVAVALGWLAGRRRRFAIAIAFLAVGLGSTTLLDAAFWRIEADGYARMISRLEATSTPIYVEPDPANPELADAVADYLPGRVVATPVPGCLDVDPGRATIQPCR